MTLTTTKCYLAAFAGVLLMSGCGSSDVPDLVVVTGRVVKMSKPVPGAVVVFRPQKGRPSSAFTDENGEFELAYTGNEKGATLGQHTVIINVESGGTPTEQGPRRKSTMPDEPIQWPTPVTIEEAENQFEFDIATVSS